MQQFIKENHKIRLTRRTKCQKRETPEQRAQPVIRSGTQLPHARPKLPPLRKVRNIRVRFLKLQTMLTKQKLLTDN